MARVFNTTFIYNNAIHGAVITISKEEEGKKVCIDLLDKSLHPNSAATQLILDGETGLPTDQNQFTADPELIKSVWEAVEAHEKDQRTTSLWS